MGINVDIKEKRFGRKVIFKDFNYSFSDVGLYVIKAKSGMGKTTLLRIIAGLDKDYVGSVSGIERGEFSMHFQEYRLFDSLCALDNVSALAFANPNDENIAAARSLLLSLGLTEEELRLYPKELSGGMKMRVSLARAVLKDSKCLLLDEPTKELDEETKARVIELINKVSLQKLVIMVTHDSDFDALCKPTLINL